MSRLVIHNQKSFTLIELLVVIAIIGLLATIVMISVGSVREKAMIAKSQADVVNLYKAIQMLELDTSKGPNGCPLDQTTNPEISLDSKQAGLIERPDVGVTPNSGGKCEWTQDAINHWNGPYIAPHELYDHWGNKLWFDPDYWTLYYKGCLYDGVAIGSNGPDKVSYTCDDIVKMFHACNLATGDPPCYK